jgi:hypothetical protein
VLNRRQQLHPRGDDRERITRAQQAAEALFTPKPQLRRPLRELRRLFITQDCFAGPNPRTPARQSAESFAERSRVRDAETSALTMHLIGLSVPIFFQRSSYLVDQLLPDFEAVF